MCPLRKASGRVVWSGVREYFWRSTSTPIRSECVTTTSHSNYVGHRPSTIVDRETFLSAPLVQPILSHHHSPTYSYSAESFKELSHLYRAKQMSANGYCDDVGTYPVHTYLVGFKLLWWFLRCSRGCIITMCVMIGRAGWRI